MAEKTLQVEDFWVGPFCEKYKVPIQITSLRAPDEVVPSAHRYGGLSSTT